MVWKWFQIIRNMNYIEKVLYYSVTGNHFDFDNSPSSLVAKGP